MTLHALCPPPPLLLFLQQRAPSNLRGIAPTALYSPPQYTTGSDFFLLQVTAACQLHQWCPLDHSTLPVPLPWNIFLYRTFSPSDMLYILLVLLVYCLSCLESKQPEVRDFLFSVLKSALVHRPVPWTVPSTWWALKNVIVWINDEQKFHRLFQNMH